VDVFYVIRRKNMALLTFLPDLYQGIIIMVAGVILLLHTLGFMERGLHYLLIAGALYMIILGFVKMDGVERARRLWDKKK
jgi:hypothetical protein